MTLVDVLRAETLVIGLYEKRPERLVHIESVIRVIWEMNAVPVPEVFVAGYLHDVLDDLVITRGELRDILGEEALKLADDLSESFTVSCGRRCTFFENLPALRGNPAALEVRLAARFANWRKAIEAGLQIRRQFYRQDYALFRSELIKLPANPLYWDRLDGLMEELPEASWVGADGVRQFGVVRAGVAFRD